MLMASNQMWHEMKNIVLISTLTVLYILLLCPYIILTKSNQIYQHWAPYDLELYRNLSTSYYEEESPADTAPLAPIARSEDLDVSTNLTLHDPGIWEVPEIKEGTNDAETVFVWLRYIHCALVPLVILVLNKDIRQKAADLVLCCGRARSSSITPRPISALLHRQHMEHNRRNQKKKFKLCDYHVPVLFATQEGLFLRILDGELPSPSKEQEQEVNKNMWTVEPQFLTELCDLKIETQTSVTHYLTNEENMEQLEPHLEDDEGFHEHHTEDISRTEKKEKKKVHFRNTVLEIGQHVEEFDSGHSSEHRDYRDVHQRKMTGLGERHDSHQDGRHSSRSHKKHRRHSFNPEQGGHRRSHRRNSEPIEELHLH